MSKDRAWMTNVLQNEDEDDNIMPSAERSVQEISKMFEQPSSSSYRKSTYTYSDSPGSTTTTTVTKGGTTSETTILQTSRTSRTSRTSNAFNERVLSSSQSATDKLYESLIPSAIKTGSPTDSKSTLTMTETVTVKSGTDITDAQEALVDTLIPSSPKTYSPSESRNGLTTTTRRTSSTAEDELYGTLLNKTITSVSSSPVSSSSITKREIITVESSRGGDSTKLISPSSSTRRSGSYSSTVDIPTHTTSYSISSTPSDDYNSDRKSYSYKTDSYEYSSLNSPTVFTSESYRSNSKSDDLLAGQTYSTSVTSVYAPPERTVLEKDLCTICRKPFTGEAKMVLDDMKINCHASCFKCEVCNSTLGHMKAGDSMWIYKRMVHCENCFEVTREKWRR